MSIRVRRRTEGGGKGRRRSHIVRGCYQRELRKMRVRRQELPDMKQPFIDLRRLASKAMKACSRPRAGKA